MTQNAMDLTPVEVLEREWPDVTALIDALGDAEYVCGEHANDSYAQFTKYAERQDAASNALAARLLALLSVVAKPEDRP